LMKYGIVISVSKTKFGPVVFKENLSENIVKASEMGYDGVELAIRNPEAVDRDEVARLTEKYGLEVLSIGTGQIYGEEGLNFSDTDKEVREKAVERTKKIIDIAKDFNASIIIGLVRGNIKGTEDIESKLEIAEDNISQCLAELMVYSEKEGIKFLVEPINRYEVNIFNRLDEVYSFLTRNKGRLDIDRIGILADTFHMNIEEPVIEKSIQKYTDLIKHIHFADSNRWPPGYGHIDFKKVLNTLKESDYEGYISFEMLPMPDPDTAAKHAIRFIKELEQ
ncbi:MAG: 5-keto-L-gluconate epimerase, partial [Candidatus Humimicrobiaceae bacterium]